MAIPSRQIGWSTKSNLLWEISKQLEALTGIMGRNIPVTTTTTTSSTSTTTTTTTSTTSTTTTIPPSVTYYYNVTGYSCGNPCNNIGPFTAQSTTALTIGLFYNNPENRGYSFEILEERAPILGGYDLTGEPGYATCTDACP
tara:strand:- start:485 stop:910 length:426 start_codon:yes stop_codon:yes gene_type:complete